MQNLIEIPETPIYGPVPAKATLFALPVIIHPQLAREDFPADPLLPRFEVVQGALKPLLDGEDNGQSFLVLDRVVSPSFLARALKDELGLASLLVCGHVHEQEDPCFILENQVADWICDAAIERSKHMLVFVVGAVYRQEEDPAPLTLPHPTYWSNCSPRRQIEAHLSRGPSLLRNSVLVPSAIGDALLNGFEALCRMYVDMHGGDARVDAEFDRAGGLVLHVRAGSVSTEIAFSADSLPVAYVEQLLGRLDQMRPPGFTAMPSSSGCHETGRTVH